MFGASQDPLHELVVIQGQRAIETADVVVFVVDGREGLVPADRGDRRRAADSDRQPVLLAVNKTDDKKARGRRARVLPSSVSSRSFEIAAEHGEGVGDLLDEVVRAAAAPGRRTGEDARGNRDRHRRAAQRRQVVAA